MIPVAYGNNKPASWSRASLRQVDAGWRKEMMCRTITWSTRSGSFRSARTLNWN